MKSPTAYEVVKVTAKRYFSLRSGFVWLSVFVALVAVYNRAEPVHFGISLAVFNLFWFVISCLETRCILRRQLDSK